MEGVAPATPDPATVADRLTVVMSFRVTSTDRLAVLATVLRRFDDSMAGAPVPLQVRDASSGEWADRAGALFAPRSPPTSYVQASESLSRAYLRSLRETDREYVYLQFDDQLAAGLSPGFLDAACGLLSRYKGELGVVSILWPWRVTHSDATRTVEVTTHRVQRRRAGRPPRYSFGRDPFRAPLVVERIGGFEFGIFENFTYGFYFNHLVAPVDDYASRLEWYIDHVGENAHQIELAAGGRTLGPYWTHIAVCLDDISLLDLDFEHTVSAVRAEGHANRATFEALSNGYDVRTTHLDV
jgi:hypothetical protein